VTGVAHRFSAAWSHGSAVRFAKPARIALSETWARRQRRPTRLPPHHAPSAGSSTRRSRTKSIDPRACPAQPARPLRGGPRTGYDRANAGTALAVRGGPGESRGLCHFFHFWNVASARISTIKIKHCFAIWHLCLASGPGFDEPHDFLYGIESLLRSD
jgi:hypothetical protein